MAVTDDVVASSLSRTVSLSSKLYFDPLVQFLGEYIVHTARLTPHFYQHFYGGMF